MSFVGHLTFLIVCCASYAAVFIWLHKTNQLDRSLAMFLAVVLYGPMLLYGYGFVWKSYVEESVADQCGVYLKGEVYCRHCRTSHPIRTVRAKQVWSGGTSDQGWDAYVFPEKCRDGSCGGGRGYDLTLYKGKVVKMKYDPEKRCE